MVSEKRVFKVLIRIYKYSYTLSIDTECTFIARDANIKKTVSC